LTRLFVQAISSPAGTETTDKKPSVLDPNRVKAPKVAKAAVEGDAPKAKAAAKKPAAKKTAAKKAAPKKTKK
jgi:hypothetical protein